MKIIHRYVLKEVFYYFFVLLLIFVTILLAKETYDTKDEILDEDPAMLDVVQYVFLSMPSELADAVPLIAMFAVLFAIGMMARHREIIAMVSAGVPFSQIAIPVAIFGGVVSLGLYLFSDFVVPAAQTRSRFLYEVRIKGENLFAFMSNDEIFRKGEGERFYIMANFNGQSNEMTRPIILDRDNETGRLRQRIEAESARLVETRDGKERYWVFKGTERWIFDEAGGVDYERFDEPLRIKMEEKLDSFLNRDKRPAEMRSDELSEFSAILDRQGAKVQLARYRTAFHAKFAIPLACLLLALVGFSVSADLRVRRFILAFSVGLFFGIFYYVLREAMVGFGSRGLTPPLVGAWAPVVIFSLVVAFLMRRLSSVN